MADQNNSHIGRITGASADSDPRAPQDRLRDTSQTDASATVPSSATTSEPTIPFEGPRNPIEAAIAEIWAGLLKVERVSIHDNFLLLGGESLLATQAASRIRNRFECEVTLRSILVGTVADVAAEIVATIDYT